MFQEIISSTSIFWFKYHVQSLIDEESTIVQLFCLIGQKLSNTQSGQVVCHVRVFTNGAGFTNKHAGGTLPHHQPQPPLGVTVKLALQFHPDNQLQDQE